MSKLSFLLFELFFVTAICACQSSSCKVVDSFEHFVERSEKKATVHDRVNWDIYDSQFENYLEEINKRKHSLSSEEREKVGELTARYCKARFFDFQGTLIDEMNCWSDYLMGFTNEIKRDVENYQNQ